MALLGIDVGTTHCKAGLFDVDGTALRISSRPMSVHRSKNGDAYFDPGELWETVSGVIKEVAVSQSYSIAAIGIASMAETGLLVDRNSGDARSNVIPWFDTAAQVQADILKDRIDPSAFYIKTGLWVSYKCSLAKLLWLRERDPQITHEAIWLSAADYVAYKLTQSFGTDYSLAGRTGAFNIECKTWDEAWLKGCGLSPEIFPPVFLSGTPIENTTTEWASLGIPSGIPVAVCGHDHVCGALAAGAVKPGLVFDSMGTAEALLGTLPQRPLTEKDHRLGLMAGCHVVQDRQYWMGGLSTSGGSIEWLRTQLASEPLSYDDLLTLLETTDPQPTGILFFPYLLGSGSPHSDPLVRGAFVGLRQTHDRAELVKAVLEGTAYEMNFIRLAGEQMTGQPIETFMVAGGGTRNRYWLQIKADISGCQILVSPETESTLLGAALSVGIGCGLYADDTEALATISNRSPEVINPDPERHEIYQTLFNRGFLRLQEPLREFSNLDLFKE
jgi:sugar (pentulose or hexulose) kinase